MKTRTFLTDKNIVGAMLVSRCGKILEYSIPNLLKWCDWILIMYDNEEAATVAIVDRYRAKYGDRIRVAHSGFPPATKKQEEVERGLFGRFKRLQGPIRDTIFKYMREENEKNKIDILIWPDSDEIFSDHLPKLLEDFVAMEDKRAISMKPIDVFGDMQTVQDRSMTGHTRIMKFFPELTADPYRVTCNYRPLTKQDRIGSNKVLIHLCNLLEEKVEWRNKNWKPTAVWHNWALWKLTKPVYNMTPDEISAEMQREPDLNIKEYLRGGNNRKVSGVNNAKMALEESYELLTSMGVKLYIAFGTCLGIVRDGEVIKWDWDVDFVCLAEDLGKIDSNKIVNAGFKDFKRKNDAPKSIVKGVHSDEVVCRTMSFKKYGVRVDIDPAYLSADGKLRIIPKGRKRDKFAASHPAEMFSDGVVNYDGIDYPILTPVDEYIKSNYGENWKEPAYGPTAWSKRSCLTREYEIK